MKNPKIRFKGFTGVWEQRKLGEVLVDYTEKNPIDEVLPVLTSSRQGIQSQEKHFGRVQQHDTTDYNVIPLGYCTYRNRSDDKSFVFNVNDSFERGIVSKFYPVFTFDGCNAKFMTVDMNSNPKITNDISILAVGTSQVVLSISTLKGLKLLLPSEDEQDKIGQYLKTIDTLITLYQQKCEETITLKKYMLQKMFPQNGSNIPEIRFDGFTNAWEQRKLGDVFEEYSEKNHPELPALTIIQGGGTILREESDRNLQYDKSSLSGYKMVSENDFVVHLRSFEGGLEKASHNGLISPAYHTLHGIEIDSRFYYQYFRSFEFIRHKLVPHVYGIRDGRSIDIDGMKTISIPWTTYEEQTRIGDYIDSLDALITLHQRMCNELQNIKKYMLQNMFV